MSSKTTKTTVPAAKKPARGGSTGAPVKGDTSIGTLSAGFKPDRSKAAKSMSKAFALTQKRLHGEKRKIA